MQRERFQDYSKNAEKEERTFSAAQIQRWLLNDPDATGMVPTGRMMITMNQASHASERLKERRKCLVASKSAACTRC